MKSDSPTIINAHERTYGKYPDNDGANIAKILLESSNTNWNDIIINLRKLNTEIIISVFFSSFLQTIYDMGREHLDDARKIKWEVNFNFQSANIERWMQEFQPFEDNYDGRCPCGGACCANPKTFTPKHKCYTAFCEDCFTTECKNCSKSCSCDL